MLKPYSLPEAMLPGIYRDYLAGLPQALCFLSHHFADEQALDRVAGEAAAAFQGDRCLLADMLVDYNRGLGAAAPALAQAKKLADPRAVAVLAGQQAGLCGGPLYTVYKALAAVRLAHELEEKLGRPVVPVFWIATEDHDFSEANHFWLLDKDNRLQKVTLELEHRGEPVGRLPLKREAVSGVVAKLAALVLESEFSADVLLMLEQTGELASTPAEWFARIFAVLFASEGLVLFDPLLPGARRMLAPFLREAVERRGEAAAALAVREAALGAAGYTLQVAREEEASLLMLMGEKRSALYWKDGRFTTRDGAAVFSEKELCALAEESPELLSPNVLLRPLAQDRLFPTAAYLPGPGELAYFAQLTALYPVFGIPQPVLVPRPGLTVIEPRFARYIKKLEIPEEALLLGLEGFLEDLLGRRAGVDLDGLFGRLQELLAEEYRRLGSELGRLDRGLVALSEKNLQYVYTQIAYLKKKAQEEVRRKNEVIVRQVGSLGLALRPLGRLQERVFTYFPYQMKYGPDFWQGLAQCFPERPGHWLFYYQPGKENG